MDKIMEKLDELESRLKDSWGMGTILPDGEFKALIKIARAAKNQSVYNSEEMDEALKEFGDL